MRRAFTLVEMMIASGIFAIVAGGVLGAVIGIQRMAGAAAAETELALNMRMLREKLLFHLTPGGSGCLSKSTPDFSDRDWLRLDSGAGVNLEYENDGGVHSIEIEMTVNRVTRRQCIEVPAFWRDEL